MKNFNEWQRTQNTKTITVTCRDNDDTLEKLLKCIKTVGNMGHTFMIVVDDHDKFEWDGDGSDSIHEIKVSKG